jgi:epoxyqueuosine reductase
MVNTEILSILNQLRAEAKNLGFSLCGITNLQKPKEYPIFLDWITAGLHEMSYLAKQDTLAKRQLPQILFPGANSIIVLAYPYPTNMGWPEKNTSLHTGRIGSYAWMPDYHLWLNIKMTDLMVNVQAKTHVSIRFKSFSDSAPILERELAARAGLGWIGKNSCLISPRFGSFFLLGEIFTDLELPVSIPFTEDRCGTCQRCIQACPTGCILPNRTLDARKCISYLTIESERAIPLELRAAVGDWVFGCDLCQVVCPWNQHAARYHPSAVSDMPVGHTYCNLVEDIQLDEAVFIQNFQDSPIARTKRTGYLRNIAVALGNQPDPELLPLYQIILENEKEPIVRQHLAWAVARIGTTIAYDLLKKHFRLETDASVQAEIGLLLH